MKRSSLYTLVLLFSGLVVLFSCRKDIEYYLLDRERPTSEVMESAKIWYLKSIDKESVDQRLKPHWKDSWQVSREKGAPVLVVPANERQLNNKDISIRRFFIFTVDGSNVKLGVIVEFLGEKYDVTSNLDFLLKSLGKEEIDGFNGAILQYDINYRPMESVRYTMGKKDKAVTPVLKALSSKEITDIFPYGKGKREKVTVTKLAIVNPGRKVMYTFPCSSNVPVTWTNMLPENLCEDALITIYTQYYYTYGCLDWVTITYISHTCPPGSSGSGDDSGSGSGSGDGGGDPEYGGGLSAEQKFLNRIDASGLPKCIRDILEKLNTQQGNTVADMLRKLDGSVPGYNWKINADPNMGVMEYGGVDYPYNANQNTVVGRINTSATVMSEVSELAMAKTLAHEAIHAYLVNELRFNTDSARQTYPQLFNKYRILKNQSVSQHNVMIQNFIGNIASSIQYYAQEMGYSTHIDNQVYQDLAWGGLTHMPAFETIVTDPADRARIENRIKAEHTGEPHGGLYPVGNKLSVKCNSN